MGYAVTAFESIVSSLIFKRPLEMGLLSKLSALIPGLLIVYLILRWGTLAAGGALGAAFGGGWKMIMFWIENLLFLIPLVLLLPKANRGKAQTVCLASFSMLLAGAVYRFNTFLVGFSPAPGWSYFPSAPEIFITLGIVAAFTRFLFTPFRLSIISFLRFRVHLLAMGDPARFNTASHPLSASFRREVSPYSKDLEMITNSKSLRCCI